ncbi:hypothetical protein I302_106252 [Kwoniella bestiolae CBS 10118]|uniref:Uncharacterized protein n=1 Tax=Kwoniella bestiolae CBS 10118 TaxID=1296100 RepID=A0A1B9G3G5_9TREE|nr:hypothetical protein I302_05376 [Kwoniella bestiolae CBS 10118]OCF25556.1 hypothetical protein I302_05376 [Kwoniella bestiolae CBS 10118]
MRIIRLSSVPTPQPQPEPTAPLTSAISSRSLPLRSARTTQQHLMSRDERRSLLSLISTWLIPPLMALSLVLTLLPLLLPSITHQSLTYFTIRPTGDEKAPRAVAINLNEGFGVVKNLEMMDERDEVIDGLMGLAESVGGREWLGKSGASVYVGILQICSKANPDAEVNCTSSSQAEYHATFLPDSLRSALLNLPSPPPTPILLLASAILLFLATLVFIAGLIPWRCSISFNFLHRKPPLEADPHWARTPYQQQQSKQGYTGSCENLVQAHTSMSHGESGKGVRRNAPHLAFFALIFIALGLTGGSLVQLRIIREAQDRWDKVMVQEVGMEFKVGVLTYLLPILPICLVFILLLAALPSIYAYIADTFHTCPADHDHPDSPDPLVPGYRSDLDQREVGKRWDQTPILNPSPAYIPEIYDLPIVKSEMESKRSTIESVGKAL